MSQLKPSFVAGVKKALENSVFTEGDFEIQLPKTGKVLVKLVFLHKPDYFLECSETIKQEEYTVTQKWMMESRNEKRRYSTVEAQLVPGEFKARETIELSELGQLADLIPKWCSYLRDDLYALAPKQDLLGQLREKFKNDIEQGIADPESYFTEEEVSRIGEKFDAMVEELNHLKEEFSLTKQQLDQIKKEVEEFKNSAQAYPKGVWAKVTSNRLVQFVGKFMNTSEGRKFLFEQAKRILGGDGA